MQTVLILNSIIILIYLINAFNGYRKGFIYSILKFLALIFNLIFSYKFAQLNANSFKISQYLSLGFQNKIQTLNLEYLFNVIGLFVISFIVLSLLFIFILSLLNKLIMKIPFISGLNKILGLIVSLIYSTLIVLFIAVVLNMPFISGGKELQSKSLIAPISKIAENISNQIIVKFSDFSKVFNNFIKQIGSDKNSFLDWIKIQKITNKSQFEQVTGLSFYLIENYYGLNSSEVFSNE